MQSAGGNLNVTRLSSSWGSMRFLASPAPLCRWVCNVCVRVVMCSILVCVLRMRCNECVNKCDVSCCILMEVLFWNWGILSCKNFWIVVFGVVIFLLLCANTFVYMLDLFDIERNIPVVYLFALYSTFCLLVFFLYFVEMVLFLYIQEFFIYCRIRE